MSTPIPVLPYQAGRRWRDYFGIASLPFAMIDLALFFEIQLELRGGAIIIPLHLAFVLSLACRLFAVGFAATGIILKRGRSTAGWRTLGIYGVAILLHCLRVF